MPTLEERIQTLEDEVAIRKLASAFADAATRNNMHELTELWKKDGTLTIGEPMLKVSVGIEAIVVFLKGLRANKEFFVQFVNSGVTTVNGHHATAQWIIEEVAKGEGKFYHTYCVVSDRLEKIEGRWFFCGALLSRRIPRFLSLFRRLTRASRFLAERLWMTTCGSPRS